MSIGTVKEIRSRLASVSKLNKIGTRKRTDNPVAPVMIYIDHGLNAKWEEAARTKRVSKSQLAREGIEIRLNGGDPFTDGFNHGLASAVEAAHKTDAFKMKFPSGKSFAELLEETVADLYREQEDGGN